MDISPEKRTSPGIGDSVRENDRINTDRSGGESFGDPIPEIADRVPDEEFGSVGESSRAGKASRLPDLRELIRYAPAAAYFAAAAVMSSVGFTFGTYPFGFALLCAARGTEFVIAALGGMILGSIFANGGAFITICALVVTVSRCAVSVAELRSDRGRALRRERARERIRRRTARGIMLAPESVRPAGKVRRRTALFEESLAVRCALCAGAVAVCSAAAVVYHGNVYRAVAASVLAGCVAPLLCIGFDGVFLRGKDRVRFGYFVAAASFALAWALSGIGIFGFSVGALFVMLCAVWGAWCLRLPDAVLYSLAVSLAMPLAFVPSVLLATVAFGMLKKYSAVVASCVAGAVALSFAVGANGLSSLSVCGAEYIVASALSVPLAKLGLFDRLLETVTGEIPAEPESEAVMPDELQKHIDRTRLSVSALGKCFTSLGQLASTVSRALSAPSETEAREKVARAFDRACANCREQSRCFGGDYAALADYQRTLTSLVRSGNDLRGAKVPGEIMSRCPRLPLILKTISPDRVGEGELGGGGKCDVFARDFTAAGEMLSEMSDRLGLDMRVDSSASRTLREALALIGVHCESVRVYGERMKYTELRGVDPSLMQAGSDEIRRCAEGALGVRMTEPRIALDGDTLRIVMQAGQRLRVSVGRASTSASQEACGDSTAAFAGDDGYFRCILSDGMGSGTEAAFTAGTVTLFLERLLSAGVKLDASLGLVNRFLRERHLECSATVDLMELDLISGDARFVKSGAAPSFVLRGGRLFKLRSRTVPIGILPTADAEAITFRVETGDRVVMLSDGVTGTSEDCPWLYDLLCKGASGDLTATARRIADEAAKRGSDDVSVIVMRIGE